MYLVLVTLISFDICSKMRVGLPNRMIKADFLALSNEDQFVHIESDLHPTECSKEVYDVLQITSGYCLNNVTIAVDCLVFT